MSWKCKLGIHSWKYNILWIPSLNAPIITEYKFEAMCGNCGKVEFLVHEKWNGKEFITMELFKYYEEGKIAFSKTLNPIDKPNPYGWPEGNAIDEITKRNLWFDGYRNASKEYFNNKYRIPELQNAIRNLILSHGLEIEYDSEYDTPYGRTPEGYVIVIAEEQEVL
jgi:hypothetical protein